MKHKSYSKVVVAFSLALAIAISLWFASPVMLFYAQAQGGYGGGGGAGGAGESYPGLCSLEGRITSGGVLFQDVNCRSSCALLCTLTISQGTKIRTKWGAPLYWIIMIKMEDSPPAPQGFDIVGCVSDGTPEGATFEPALTLTFTYDEALLPEGFDEKNLVIAMWDETTGKWVILDSTVDPDTNTITTQISHFTPFAVLAGTAPAAFTVTDLAIVPSEAVIGGRVTISALVTNTGYLSGSYEVTLKLNDVVVATEKVTLPGHASQKVTFTTTKDVAGTYSVDVNGVSGTFEVTVREAPPSPPAPPPPVIPPPTPINWYLIGGIIAGCIIIGVIIWLTAARRRAG